jgi:LPS O-antigen subunit length determinant protein (WzzB/FepE family)
MTRIILITAIAFAVSALLTSILASPVKSYENYSEALALIEK